MTLILVTRSSSWESLISSSLAASKPAQAAVMGVATSDQ
jgi:hypothetical protein